MRIALVDPSRTVQKIVGRMLEARAHEVLVFSNPKPALEHVGADSAVALVLTSAEFADMPGVEFCWHARALANAGRSLYIIMMSSETGGRRLAEALDSGADDFIRKPPEAEELYARVRAAERLMSLQRELTLLAKTDPLTQVCNRRAFFAEAHALLDAARSDAALSALMLDIDHFKSINDSRGHQVGDQVLREVAKRAARVAGVFGRLGGEEFAGLLPNTDLAAAMALAERVRADIEGCDFFGDAQGPRVTCSLGVTRWRPAETIDDLLRRADQALYRAKAAGRNRVVAEAADAPPLGGAPSFGIIRSVPR
jgi:diguanylate cyclase (GGDEF)-like protein